MYDFSVAVHAFDVKAYRTLHAVQVIIEAGTWIYKYRCGDTQKVQLLGKCLLEKVFDSFNCYLSIMEIKVCMLAHRNFHLFHGHPPC